MVHCTAFAIVTEADGGCPMGAMRGTRRESTSARVFCIQRQQLRIPLRSVVTRDSFPLPDGIVDPASAKNVRCINVHVVAFIRSGIRG